MIESNFSVDLGGSSSESTEMNDDRSGEGFRGNID